MAAKDLTFGEIKGNIRLKKFMPVYLFHGDESYFIDQLTDLLIESALNESERDFNQTILYGADSTVAMVIDACRRYPMMAERQLVVVKEAQNLKNIDNLTNYVKNPLNSTVLVINYKNGKLDVRKKLVGEVAKTGIVFESKRIYENKVPDFIVKYLKEKQIGIDAQSTQILTDCIGNDLSKVINELDKLTIALPSGVQRITPELIEQNIGISKEFNNYELQRAIALGDILKANRIAMYFEQNPKNNPYIPTLNVLFAFFSNLIICHFDKDKSKQHIMQILGIRSEWDPRLNDYIVALKRYNPTKTMKNIALIREYDAKGKGVDNSGTPAGKLLIELVYKLTH